jgi:hypothetical protein
VAVGERAGRRLRVPARRSRDLRVDAGGVRSPLTRSLASARETGRPSRSLTSVRETGRGSRSPASAGETGSALRSPASAGRDRADAGTRASKARDFGRWTSLGGAASAGGKTSVEPHTGQLRLHGKPGDLGRRDASAAKVQGPTSQDGGSAARSTRGTGTDGSSCGDGEAEARPPSALERTRNVMNPKIGSGTQQARNAQMEQAVEVVRNGMDGTSRGAGSP